MSRPLDLLLGRVAVDLGLLTQPQVEAALRAQQVKNPEPPLWLVLLESGPLTDADLDRILQVQSEGIAALHQQEGPRLEPGALVVWRFAPDRQRDCEPISSRKPGWRSRATCPPSRRRCCTTGARTW